LIHEAYVRLIDQRHVRWQNRTHFYAVAAQLMRRILVDHARGRRRAKRGGSAARVPLEEALVVACVTGGTIESGISPAPVSWSRDSAFAYIRFNRATYAIPLQPGSALPSIPAAGFRNEQELAGLRGAQHVANTPVFAGGSPSVYAFTKVATQRNIYRVPAP
jgi:ECF sigma factor